MLFKNLKPFICFILLSLIVFSSCFGGGSGDGTSTDDTSNTIPSPPSSVSVTADDTILTINWSAVSDAISYEIWINDTNNKTTATQVGGVISATGYTITGLTNGQTYYVWLKSKNPVGTSDFSDCFSGTPAIPLSIPPAPGAAVLTAGNNKLILNWSSVSGAVSYEVWYNSENNTSTAIRKGSDLVYTNYTITGLTNGQNYYVWLKAKNSAGTSDFGTMSEGVPQLFAPSEPGSAYIVIGYKQLTLAWSQVTDAVSYEVWYSLTDDVDTAAREDVVITATNYILTGLENNQRYYIWLKAKNAAGTSDFGPVAYGTPSYTPGYTLTYNLPDNVVFKFKYVPGGTFPTSFGTQTKPTDEDAMPETVSYTYWMAETEVTYELWQAVYTWATDPARGDSIYTFANPGRQGGTYMGSDPVGTNQHPVTTVNWRDSIIWCNALTEYYNANNGSEPDLDCVYFSDPEFNTPIRTSTSSTTITGTTLGSQDAPYVDDSSKGFRLPTSLEWECAARYKDGTNWIMGICASGASSHYSSSSYAVVEAGSTRHVKSKLPNSLGIYDMSGNIREWCFRPAGPSMYYPVYGGDWYQPYNEYDCPLGGSSSIDYPYVVDNSSLYPGYTKGFRIARSE